MRFKKIFKEKTIRSETTKVFLVIFLILSGLGFFTIYSTKNGAKTFEKVKDIHLDQFISAENLKQKALEVISVSYVLSNGQDHDLLMQQLLTYDSLIASYESSFKTLQLHIQNNNFKSNANLSKLLAETENSFSRLVEHSRQMTFAFLENKKTEGAKFFKLLNEDVSAFKKNIDSIESIVQENLNVELKSSQKLLSYTSQLGLVLTAISILITVALIYYLMKFLSISLLPISNLMHNLRQAVFSIDHTLKVIAPVSKYSETVFEGEIVNKEFTQLFDNEMSLKLVNHDFRTELSKAFGKNENEWNLIAQKLPIKLESTNKIIKLTYTPLLSKIGTIVHIMIVAEDITEVEKLRDEALVSQKNMENILNNLEQGFFIFDQKGVVQPGISKGAKEIFELDPTNKSLPEVLRVKTTEIETINEWFEILFKKSINFKALADLGPNTFEAVEGKFIELSYRPIYNSNSSEKTLERVICIAEDKTKERFFKLQAEVESEFAKMILTIVNDRYSFNDFIIEVKNRITKSKTHVNNSDQDLDIDFLFREMHTIKGEAATFHVNDLKNEVHKLEQYLSGAKIEALKSPKETRQILNSKLIVLGDIFDKIIENLSSLIGDLNESEEQSRIFNQTQIENFYLSLKSIDNLSASIQQNFVNEFILEDIGSYILKYKNMSEFLAKRLNKEVNFLFKNETVKLYIKFYQPLLSSLVHVYRNAVDHGIEDVDRRIDNGKSRIGQITTSVRVNNINKSEGGSTLIIEVADDGAGIDIDTIVSKAIDAKLITEQMLEKMSDYEKAQLVFSEDLSSRDLVTDISGRGVGLGAVFQEAKKIGGNAFMTTEPGVGSNLTIEVPLRNALV